ncbi:MAG: hypothetical protein KAU90_10995, partial [Sulfurovaceae bacterium]|nr:hypothetical protein [Sulfurovaceae bacterium]
SGSGYIIDSESESEIINDDGDYPSIDFSTGDFSIVEGNTSTKMLNFHFELDAPALAGSSFKYYTKDGSAKVDDNDYIKIHTKTYNIKKDTKDIDIPVTIKGDTQIEEDELFYLKIKKGSEHHIQVVGHTAKGHILNDDGSYPELSFTQSEYSIDEGDSGQKDINITLQLSKPSKVSSSFEYRTRDNISTTNKATANDDYQSIPYTTYHINIGEQYITIPIKINGDSNIENDEDFIFKIKSEQNITISDDNKVRTVSILNDDGDYPTINIDSDTYSVLEGNSSQKNLKINLTLDAPALSDTTIDYYTSNSTAKDGSSPTEDKDYIRTHGRLAIEENTKTASINIPILGDTLIESDEEFKFYIHNPQNLHLGSKKVTTITIINDDVDSDNNFTCDEHMYISSSKKRGSNQTGKMWLHRIDTTQNPFRFEVMNDEGEEQQYNAIAYNPNDNYIYALFHRELLKITKSGKVMNIGKIRGLPEKFEEKQLYAGAINQGYYFVTGRNIKQKYLYKIKLSDLNVTDINLTKKVAIQDFSFYYENNATKYLYGVNKNGKLTKIDSTNGVVTSIGSKHTGYAFDSSFSYKDGRFFANDSNGNGFFEFNLQTGEKYFLSDSQLAKFNDGANCINHKSPNFYD